MPAPSSLVLHLSDSEVAEVRPLDATIIVRFAVAQVTPATADPGPMGEAGYLRGLSLVLEDTVQDQPLEHGRSDLFGRLRSGRLITPAGASSTLPLDAVTPGPVSLELDFGNGCAGRWRAARLRVARTEGEEVMPSYAC